MSSVPESPARDSQNLEALVRDLQEENLALRKKVAQYEYLDAILSAQPQSENNSLVDVASPSFNRATASLSKQSPERLTYQIDEKTPYDLVPTYPERPHFTDAPKHPATEIVTFDGCPNDPYHPSSMPIYQTATFVQPNISEYGPYDYTRSGNPTRTAVETLVARIEGAHASFAFTSGMASLQSLLAIQTAGDHVLASSDLYGGMHRLLSYCGNKFGLSVDFIDMDDLAAVEAHIIAHEKKTGKKTTLIHVESPTNPRMHIIDLRGLSEVAKRHGAFVSVDCTMMTPLRQRPLALGCNAVIQSGTKFFSGHSDTMAGFLSVSNQELANKVAFVQNAEGTALAPFDSWLLLRGLKTLSLRVDQQELNAIAVARFLATVTSVVTKLNFAGLNPEDFPSEKEGGQSVVSITKERWELHKRQASGPGSVLSFETGCVQRSRKFVDSCSLFKLTVSFGSCNSLVEMPCLLSHASIPKEKRTLPEDLVRLSIGVESIHDIIADLQSALRAAGEVPFEVES